MQTDSGLLLRGPAQTRVVVTELVQSLTIKLDPQQSIAVNAGAAIVPVLHLGEPAFGL